MSQSSTFRTNYETICWIFLTLAAFVSVRIFVLFSNLLIILNILLEYLRDLSN